MKLYVPERQHEEVRAVVALGPGVVRLAVDSVTRHALRAYDGVQPAAAMASRDAIGHLDRFLAFDAGLRRAAAAEGFVVLLETIER